MDREETRRRLRYEGDANPFLRLNGKEWEILRGRVYATFEQAEVLQTGLFRLRFSAAAADVYDDLLRNLRLTNGRQSDIAALLARLPIYIIEIALTAGAVQSLISDTLTLLEDGVEHEPVREGADFDRMREVFEELERRWLVFEIAEGGGGIGAILYGNLFGPPRQIRLAAATPPGEALEKDLDEFDPVAAEPDASASDIEAALSVATGQSSIDAVAFYDVGQGTAQGLLRGGQVIAYADFGGGAAAHTSTFPSALTRFCFSGGPPIILSHWDEDHWSSGGRDTRSYSQTWIAPRPSSGAKLGFHHRAHASAVIAAGTLLIWPTGTPVIYVRQLTILHCTGKSRNASGLAIEVAAAAAWRGRPVLLPADAGYGDLPAPHAATSGAFGASVVSPYDAIACPHHGGLSNSPAIPKRPGLKYARLAYSYGKGNHYSHPLPNSWNDHHAAGWADQRAGGGGPHAVRNTEDRGHGPFGHIGFDWGAGTVKSPLPCGGACHLKIQQT